LKSWPELTAILCFHDLAAIGACIHIPNPFQQRSHAMKIPPSPDYLFNAGTPQQKIAAGLYESVAALPLICPHTHVDANLLANPSFSFGSPVDIFILPDHYIFRMLYSQGIPYETIGLLPRTPGDILPEGDHRKIWQCFAENFFLFRGTPSSGWLTYALGNVFGVEQPLNGANAQMIFDQISEQLAKPEYRPRALFKRFNIEVLCTTNAAEDPLEAHTTLRNSGWDGRIVPTFRPDGVTNLENQTWRSSIAALSQISGIDICDFGSFLRALENRRAFFKQMGATATDHGVVQPTTRRLSPLESEAIFQRALHGNLQPQDADQFTAHMLMEMARMSCEDGLVMQLHAGSLRNYNPLVYQRFGPDVGGDIPVSVEFTRNLQPLLAEFGNDSRLRLIVFTLDETVYGRELAPLAGHFPALRLGPPWWFHDSPNGMQRFLEQVVETAGIYNTVGFNDDTRAFPSIPARHDVWRRACCRWLAGLVGQAIIELDEAAEMAYDLAYRLPLEAYKFEEKS
jgi:glucuronate isomerase